MARIAPRDIELAVGPHVAREAWNVVRISYDSTQPEHKDRVARAMRDLFGPQHDDASEREAQPERIAV